MILCDVNVLVYAHRQDVPDHVRYKAWLVETLQGPQAYGVSDLVLSGFIRVVTHPRIFKDPTSLADAVAFAEQVRNQPHAVPVAPGQRHWRIFMDLCRQTQARGNLVPDAFFAALAIESGCDWVTTDLDFSRFPDLRWRHPLQS
jgi:toxin-antitoxin system PIN domain toxin